MMDQSIRNDESAPIPGGEPPRDDRRRLRLLVRFLLISLAFLVVIRVFILEPYGIPFDSPSMEPTVLPGDVMLVNKLPYVIRSLRYIPFTRIAIPYLEIDGFGRLERGDVVVFDTPSKSRSPEAIEQYVKRCVAVPGDTVQLVGGRIFVNGTEVPPITSPELRRIPFDTGRAWRPLRAGLPTAVPFSGMKISMDSLAQYRWRPFIESEGASLAYRNRIVFIDGLPAVEYIVRNDYFFALGDNSANSRDSRAFGPVPCRNLIGRAWRIYWSRDRRGNVRWDRLGNKVD